MSNQKLGRGSKLIKGLGNMGMSLLSGLGVTDIADKTLDLANKYLDQHKNDLKIPDLIGVNLADAEEVLDKYGLLHSRALLRPDKKFADLPINTIVSTSPSKHKSVQKNSFIKLHYINQNVKEESREIVQQLAKQKQAGKDSRQKLVNHVTHAASATTKNITSKIKLPKMKNNRH